MFQKLSINFLNELKKDEKHNELIPYTHKNPFVNMLFWNRLKVMYTLVQKNPKKVLDFGSGSGILLPTLSKSFSKVYAIDVNTSGAKLMKKKLNLKNVIIKKENGNKTKFKKGSFDAVLAPDVLEHFKNVKRPLKEIKRLLKRDGQLLISGPTENVIYEIGRVFFGHKKPKDHYHSIDDIIEIARKDFEIEEIKRVPFSLPSHFCLFKVIRARPKK